MLTCSLCIWRKLKRWISGDVSSVPTSRTGKALWEINYFCLVWSLGAAVIFFFLLLYIDGFFFFFSFLFLCSHFAWSGGPELWKWVKTTDVFLFTLPQIITHCSQLTHIHTSCALQFPAWNICRVSCFSSSVASKPNQYLLGLIGGCSNN